MDFFFKFLTLGASTVLLPPGVVLGGAEDGGGKREVGREESESGWRQKGNRRKRKEK